MVLFALKLVNHSVRTKAKTKLERLHSVRNNSNFEIATLFPSLYRCWKSAAISKLESFLTEWSRSYLVLALVLILVQSWFCLTFLVKRNMKQKARKFNEPICKMVHCMYNIFLRFLKWHSLTSVTIVFWGNRYSFWILHCVALLLQ